MNTITIEFCKEDRERLDRLTAALNNAGTPFGEVLPCPAKAPTEAPEKPQEAPKPEADKVPAEEPNAAQAENAATLADIQKKVVALSAAGKKAQVRDIVKAYAERVSLIPEDKIPEVWDKLNALEV